MRKEMFDSLPKDATQALNWEWSQYQPYFDALLARDLSSETVNDWLADATKVMNLLSEVSQRLDVAITVDTNDAESEKLFLHFIEDIVPNARKQENELNLKLLKSGLEPAGMEVALRKIKSQVELFREENLPLFTELRKLNTEYDKIKGAQTVIWEGEERTLDEMALVAQEADRSKREAAFRLVHGREAQDRQTLNDLWVKMFALRQQIAKNAGYDSFFEYHWKALGRFDYSPEDARNFHKAIEEAVVPVATRLYEKRRQKLGLDTLREWDTNVDTSGAPALRPFSGEDELIAGSVRIFQQVDSELGRYVEIMRDEKLLDLDNRKGKAPGGYCTYFAVAKKPFIFMNAVGIHDDVQTMLHEAGHGFHAFEESNLPYYWQQDPPTEFCEVASMAMEMLAAPYLTKDKGGFYSESEAARARVEYLTACIQFWPYMAVVDAFQLWAYTSGQGHDPEACDAKWTELYERFRPAFDFSGLEDWLATGWHRKLHIYQVPLYYIEYGLAQLGAAQVWAQSLKNQKQALNNYRKALSLGSTATLPELFEAAGAKLAFDSETLGEAVSLMEKTINELEVIA
jgi:oligoendopeptidase F